MSTGVICNLIKALTSPTSTPSPFTAFPNSLVPKQDIDASLFNQLSKVEDLDLSKNRILSFPSGVILPALKKLDLSDNTISQLKFLKNFSNLESLLLTANPLQENDKYLAVYLLPKVREAGGMLS